MHTRSPRVLLAACLAAVALVPATASAESRAPLPTAEIYLGSTSNGLVINLQFDRKPQSLRVTIDGRKAKIGGRIGRANLYQPVAPKGDTRPGRSYWVLVEATGKSGAKSRIYERLYLHRGFTPTRD